MKAAEENPKKGEENEKKGEENEKTGEEKDRSHNDVQSLAAEGLQQSLFAQARDVFAAIPTFRSPASAGAGYASSSGTLSAGGSFTAAGGAPVGEAFKKELEAWTRQERGSQFGLEGSSRP